MLFRSHNQVRVAYVLKKHDLERALVVLGKALEAYPGRVEDEGPVSYTHLDIYPTNEITEHNQSPEYWDVMDTGNYQADGYQPIPYSCLLYTSQILVEVC